MSAPMHFIEPVLPIKRQGIIAKRFGKDSPTADELTDRLLALRKRAVKDAQQNMRAFKRTVKENDTIKMHITRTPAGAVEYIASQSKDLGLARLGMNRSNTLRVLEPELVKSGFEPVPTYEHTIESGVLGTFDHLGLGNYWTLPDLELENNFQSFHLNDRPMVYSRELFNSTMGGQDFIGLIGANVFASTGEVMAVQHLNNISSNVPRRNFPGPQPNPNTRPIESHRL